MNKKVIAGLTAGALLLGVAPLAFAQSVIPTTTGTTGTGTTYTSPSTDTTGMGTTGSTSTTGTTGTGTTGTTAATPGVPNTGAGGNAAQNIALLVASGIIALGGAVYIARQKAFAA